MEFLSYGFMRNALIAICIITPLFGLLGTMIVNNKMAFFSDALGHSALTGMAIGVLLGFAGTDIPMILFALFFALLLNHMKRKSSASTDTIISVFSSLGTAVGLVVLSRGGNFSKYSALLVGDILSITAKEIFCLLGVLVLTLLFWLLCFNKLHACSVNKSLAMSNGIPVRGFVCGAYCGNRYAFHQMGGDFDYQCIAYFAGGGGVQYCVQYAGVSFVFRDSVGDIRCNRSGTFLLFECGGGADYCDCGSGVVRRDLFCPAVVSGIVK